MSSLAALRLLFSATGSDDGARAAGWRKKKKADEVARRQTLSSEDVRIVAELRDGNSATFETVFRTHYAALRRFAAVVLESENDADDVVVDVFAWLWETRSRLVIEQSFAAYLYTAVRHRALNAARQARTRHALQGRFSHDILTASSGRTGTDDGDDTSLLEQVREVIQSLPERRRLVISLRWEAGLGNTEIADVLGIAPQSVANLLQRALADIRAALPREFR